MNWFARKWLYLRLVYRRWFYEIPEAVRFYEFFWELDAVRYSIQLEHRGLVEMIRAEKDEEVRDELEQAAVKVMDLLVKHEKEAGEALLNYFSYKKEQL